MGMEIYRGQVKRTMLPEIMIVKLGPGNKEQT
jgi:hypothetical protein